MPRGLLVLVALGLATVATAQPAEPAPLFPFVLPWDDASPGITDLSGWLPRPAGKFGPVVARPDGHFYAGGQRLKFNGVDLAFSAAFPTHEQAEKVAARLAKFGINILRFHIMDMRRFPDGLLKRDAKDTRQFDPEALDRLDYFTKQCLDHGVYVYLCLLNYRPFNAADGLPAEIETLGGPYQGRHIPGFWNPEHLALQKEYARNLIAHRNAYTQKTYAEDPGVAMVEINNENGLLFAWLKGIVDELPADFQEDLRQRWNTWLRRQYPNTDRLRAAWAKEAQPLGDELLVNAGFANGLDPWVLELHAPAQATATVTDEVPPALAGQKSVLIDERTMGTDSWHVRFQQRGLRFAAGQGNTLHVWARGDGPGKLRVSLEMTHEPWRVLGRGRQILLTTEWQEVRLPIPSGFADDNARLVFDVPFQQGRTWLAGLSLRPGGVSGLPAGQSLEDGSVASLAYTDLGGRSAPVAADWTRFLWETERNYWQTLYHFLKDELRVRGCVIGTASGYSTPNLMAEMDAVDGHAYWQHPVFPGRPWDQDNWYVNNVSMVNARGGLLAGLAPKRVLGKPFCTTEYGHPAPNGFVSEGVLLRNAYGALQDWDYLSTSRFAQASTFDLRRIRGWFDIDQHPTRMMSQVPAAALFLRGDVAPARQEIVASLSQQQELATLPHQLAWQLIDLGPRAVAPEAVLVHRVALATEGCEPPRDALRPESFKAPADDFVSDTGQLHWDLRRPGHGVVTIDTPRSKAVIGYGAGQRYELGSVVIEPGPTRQDGWSALTVTAMQADLSGAPSRWLITATGWCENTNMGWKGPEHTSVGKNWGQAPTLVEGIAARFTLKAPADRVTVWSLDERGQRREPVPVVDTAGVGTTLDIGPRYQTLWYEVEVR